MKKFALILASTMLVCFGAQTVSADQEVGAKLYIVKECATCHQAGGRGGGRFPKLAGMDTAYIQEAFLDIQSGIRTKGMSTAMKVNPGVQSVTYEDIANIADYLSHL